MSRTMIAALAAAAVALSLSACAPAQQSVGQTARPHPNAVQTARPHPTASHSGRATPPATASPAPVPIARLSTTPGDELLTFSGTGHSSDGSSVAVTFTLHAPVAWNSSAGTSTLAAIAATSQTQVAIPSDDLRDAAWDAANAASLAVVDYSATMVSGSWHPGERVEIDLGPGDSEVAVPATGLEIEDGWWLLTGPGSGHFVIAFKNYDSSTPDPSAWGNELEIYGWAPLGCREARRRVTSSIADWPSRRWVENPTASRAGSSRNPGNARPASATKRRGSGPGQWPVGGTYASTPAAMIASASAASPQPSVLTHLPGSRSL